MLSSVPKPPEIPVITQDAVNSAISRFSTHEFHCQMFNVAYPTTGVVHPVIVVPGNLTEPVMSKRDCVGVIAQNRCYIRKPGPRSEEPNTREEWQTLLRRCVQAGREEMLDAIRGIVAGRVEPPAAPPSDMQELIEFCRAARARWEAIVDGEPADSPARLLLGRYEIGLSLVGSQDEPSLQELQERLRIARRIKLTGWTPFLEMGRPEWLPYPFDDFVEAWIGRPVAGRDVLQDPALSDYWRVSPRGLLYTIRGYSEDSNREGRDPGQLFDVVLPVWRVAEAILFAHRFAATYDGVDAIVVWVRFSGLAGRRLVSLSGDRSVFGEDVSRTDEVTVTAQLSLDQIVDNLPEAMHSLLLPLYEKFNFFRLPQSLTSDEIARLRRSRL